MLSTATARREPDRLNALLESLRFRIEREGRLPGDERKAASEVWLLDIATKAVRMPGIENEVIGALYKGLRDALLARRKANGPLPGNSA